MSYFCVANEALGRTGEDEGQAAAVAVLFSMSRLALCLLIAQLFRSACSWLVERAAVPRVLLRSEIVGESRRIPIRVRPQSRRSEAMRSCVSGAPEVDRFGLARQIRLAKKALREWPAWMRASARFEGTNHAERPEVTCRHCGGSIPCGC